MEMTKCTDIVNTERATINFAEGTVTWKPMMFNPKSQQQYERIMLRVLNGGHYMMSDFNDNKSHKL